nr:CAP domain-containing protein [Cellulomonas denverensis]
MGSANSTGEPGPGSIDDPHQYAEVLTDAVAAVRAGHDLPVLARSACAADAAVTRADGLIGADLVHAPLDDVLSDCGAALAAENLSRTAAAPDDVVQAWLASPGHRDNLLDPELTGAGVGCVRDGDELLCALVLTGD